MKIRTVLQIRKLKKLTSLFGVIIFALLILVIVFYLEYKNQTFVLELLRSRNEQLYKDINLAKDSLSRNREVKLIIVKEKEELELVNNKLLDKIKVQEKELKTIKGRYTKLSSDSLLKSLIKAYENDSIASINK